MNGLTEHSVEVILCTRSTETGPDLSRHTSGSVKNGASQDYQILTFGCLWKTLVSGTVKLFHKFEESHFERGR